MKFDTPAGPNPIDRLTVIGKATDRVDGPLKVSGTAPYAYERHDVVAGQVYGYVLGAGIAKGAIRRMDVAEAEAAPGVIAVVTADNAGPLVTPERNAARMMAGPEVEHYHQAVALVVAESFEEARAASALIRVDYDRVPGRYDLAASRAGATAPKDNPDQRHGDFETAFAAAPVTLDATYTTPDHAHAMMEPHASIASWTGDRLTVWTSHQIVDWARQDLATIFAIPADQVRVISSFVGGGFGGKLWIEPDSVLAAAAARMTGRPVRVALTRPQMFNQTTHRPSTIQRLRLGATRTGRITALAHEAWCGNLPGGQPEVATVQSETIYAGAHRLLRLRQGTLDLPEGNAMRAPGEAPGMMALEIAMDELAEKLSLDPVELRVRNDTQVDPMKPERRFSRRHLVECLRQGSERFGWAARIAKPGQVRDGQWLIGLGVASAFRGALVVDSAARVHLMPDGKVVVETDMTDVGTGSYTIIAQTAAEMMGVSLSDVEARLGDTAFPKSAGSGGQYGGNSSTSGVYAACVKLREAVAQRLGFNATDVVFANGEVRSGNRRVRLKYAAKAGKLTGEDGIEFGDLDKEYVQSTFGAHFVEVAVHAFTGETRIRRMLAVCAAGRILNPKAARNQIIGGMTMGAGAALVEELAIDKRFGFFVNHDLAGYEVLVHADVPHQDVIFLDETDPTSSPMKAKGVGELGITGVGAAVANAIYNATGVRVRAYPITLDKLLAELPQA